jgi:hypothetical protein
VLSLLLSLSGARGLDATFGHLVTCVPQGDAIVNAMKKIPFSNPYESYNGLDGSIVSTVICRSLTQDA